MAKKGLVNSINAIREISSNEYKSLVPMIDETSTIDTISTPLLNYPNLLNEFVNSLVQKIAYSQVVTKIYNNPLRFLEGDKLPLGAIGEEIYINPAKRKKIRYKRLCRIT